jgi:ubiquinone/menaquinone biosynthesis C-methylase UbiE
VLAEAGQVRAVGVWDAVAPTYFLQEPLEQRSVRVLLDALVPRHDEVLLDVGTGAGLVPRRAARAGRPASARTVVLDSSRAMLRLPLAPGSRPVRADLAALPLADASVDVVTAAWVLHLPRPGARAAAVAELGRVLRDGGRLGLVVPAAPRTPVQRLVRAAARRAASGLGAFRVPGDLPALLTAHGLRVRAHRRTGAGYLADVVVCTREPRR